jgi:Tfp pilus assembly protein PilF
MLNNTSFMLSKKLNNPALALPLAERAAKLAPTNADVLDTLGVTLLLVGRAADAEVQLRQALSNPSSPQSEITIAVHLIDALLKQQKTEEAKQLATKAQEFIARLGAQADPAIVAELQQLRTTGGI